jgi:hypothetical protein
MRFFAFMLAVIVLVLSCMPCADAAGECIGSAQTTTVAQSLIHNGGIDACNDNCSPFCSCSCCAGFTISNHQVIIPKMLIFQFKPAYNTYLFAEIVEISFPVWQPPQIA